MKRETVMAVLAELERKAGPGRAEQDHADDLIDEFEEALNQAVRIGQELATALDGLGENGMAGERFRRYGGLNAMDAAIENIENLREEAYYNEGDEDDE